MKLALLSLAALLSAPASFAATYTCTHANSVRPIVVTLENDTLERENCALSKAQNADGGAQNLFVAPADCKSPGAALVSVSTSTTLVQGAAVGTISETRAYGKYGKKSDDYDCTLLKGVAEYHWTQANGGTECDLFFDNGGVKGFDLALDKRCLAVSPRPAASTPAANGGCDGRWITRWGVPPNHAPGEYEAQIYSVCVSGSEESDLLDSLIDSGASDGEILGDECQIPKDCQPTFDPKQMDCYGAIVPIK